MIGDAASTGVLKVFDSSFNLVKSFQDHTAYIWRIIYVAEYIYIVTSGDDNLVRAWSILDWSLISMYSGHGAGVTSLEEIFFSQI